MDSQDTKKLDVVIQQAQYEDENELSLGDIWRALKLQRVKLIAWLLIGVLVGGAAGAGYALLTQKQMVTTVVQFSYDGIEKGLDPKGAVFDVNKIKSPQIVEPVLEQLGYAGNEDVTAETIRQAIGIEGLVPQDVIDRLTVVTTIATNSNAVSNLEKILDVSYYPTQFKINLDTGELKLSSEAGCVLLDRIMESYRDYFYKTYADVQLLGVALGGTSYVDYDYAEALDVMNAQINTMISYTHGLQGRSKDFRSVATGYSFADINAALEIVRTTDLGVLDALVYTYNLTRDKAMLLTYLDYQIEEANRRLTVASQTQQTIQQQLSAYEKDTVLMMGSGDAQSSAQTGVSLTLASTEYDALIRQSIEASTKVAQINADISKLQLRIDRAKGLSTVTQTEFTKRCAEADARLESLAQKLETWVDIIANTASEYFLTEEFNDAFKVLVPTQDGSHGELIELAKYGALGAVGAFGVILVLYVIGVCFGLAAGDLRNDDKKRSAKPVHRGSARANP